MSYTSRILDQVVNPLKLVDKLAFVADDWEEATMEQANLFWAASKYLLRCTRRRMRLGAQYEQLQAEVSLILRKSKFEKKRGERPTEKAINDAVTMDEDVAALRKKYDAAFVAESLAKQLLASFMQRQSALKLIGEIKVSEISTEIRSVKSRMAADDWRRHARKMSDRFEREAE